MQTLTTLDITANGIRPEWAQHLANALQHNTVRLVFYSFISFSPVSFLMQTLTTLEISHNRISQEGAQHLANALQYNTVRLVFYSFVSFSSVSFNADAYYVRYKP
jgi:Ran GTPase-activating protein (RanGAP) involved in mRNA processing and transport